MSYENKMSITADELTKLKNSGKVEVTYKGKKHRGEIGEIQLVANDPKHFFSFDFNPTVKNDKLPKTFPHPK